MRRMQLFLALSLSVADALSAQTPARTAIASDATRPLGLSLTTSGGARETIGLLVSSVVHDGPADRAGIVAGNRVLAVNGATLRLTASDGGNRDATDAAVRRVERELRAASAGDSV